ncbi:MAG: inositol monophosphatase family protein [Pseudomonadota bacterium]
MPDPGPPPAAGQEAAADRDLLVAAAEAAGPIALSHFGRAVDVREKPDGAGPVSEADLAVDRALAERLAAARPAYGWLSEETADGPERLARSRAFIVDPIDGTRAFLAGEKGWALSLAVVEAGRVIAAAVHLPARAETYAAALGAGATLNSAPLQASGRTATEGASLLAARPSLEARHWPGGVPPLARSFRTSLAWRLCLAASGRFDAMLTLRDTWEWDVAAGCLIASEAGLTVSDAAGGAPLFNRAPPRLP